MREDHSTPCELHWSYNSTLRTGSFFRRSLHHSQHFYLPLSCMCCIYRTLPNTLTRLFFSEFVPLSALLENVHGRNVTKQIREKHGLTNGPLQRPSYRPSATGHGEKKKKKSNRVEGIVIHFEIKPSASLLTNPHGRQETWREHNPMEPNRTPT